MPAEFTSGFFYREPAWHRQGTVVEHALTAAEAIKEAGLDWQVETAPLFAQHDGQQIKTPWMTTVRADTGLPLGVVSNRYHVVQNEELFAFFDKVVDPEKGAFYHTGGVLQDGRRIWLLAKVPGDFWVPGVEEDRIENYVLLASSHDGSLCIIAKLTTVRVVCSNTLSMALRGMTPASVKIRHTRNAVEQLREAHKVLGLASKRADEVKEQLDRMRRVPVTAKLIQFYMDTIFPSASKKEAPSKQSRRHRERVMELFEFGALNTLKGQRHTGLALYDATTEYVDHEYPSRKGTDRLDRLWFGQGDLLKKKAAAVLLGEVRPR